MNPPVRPYFPPAFNVDEDVALRAAQPDDAEAVYALVEANREPLRTWLPWVDGARELKHTRAFLEREAEMRLRGMTATYLILENGVIAGLIDLHDIDPLNRSFLIGYWLAERFEGRGLVTRSCQFLVKVAFEWYDMERVVIRCAVGNARSAAVARRLGFTLEGIERHGQWLNGSFIDLERYSRLRGDS